MAHSVDLNELGTALSKAQADFPAIAKDATNPFFKSKYADLATVVKMASPVLTKHGLSVSQFPGQDEAGNDTLTTWLLHSSGQYLRDTMKLHLAKTDAQGQGSALTYARRYAYMAVLGLVADEDDDGNSASRPPVYKKADPFPEDLPAKDIESDIPISNISKTKVRQAFANSGLKGDEVTALCLEVIGKPVPETEADAHLLIVELSKMPKE